MVLVCVDGSSWGGEPFPALSDVPETTGDARPRDAASVLFGITIAIEHRERYLAAFVEKLRGRLGPPAALQAVSKKAAPAAAPAAGSRTIRCEAISSDPERHSPM